jgi:hypothetical protein
MFNNAIKSTKKTYISKSNYIIGDGKFIKKLILISNNQF